jgi:hypothetical protein
LVVLFILRLSISILAPYSQSEWSQLTTFHQFSTTLNHHKYSEQSRNPLAGDHHRLEYCFTSGRFFILLLPATLIHLTST